ncbi:MAG: type II CAAX endopeptidase family protein [Brachymonas sp.]|nr:type II CAAX endopeptidase family protein [Brachymonas sp.]
MPKVNTVPASVWRARLAPGYLLPRGRFAWWYFLLALLLLVPGTVGLGFVEYVWSVWAEHSAWQHVSVLLYAPLFIAVALLTPWLASRRVEASDFPAPKGLLGWHMGVVMGITITIQIVVNVFEAIVPGARAASEQVALSLGLGASVISDVALVLAVAVLAALGEEWLFRGLLFRSLRDGLARWLPLPVTSGIGALVSSLLFAVVHVGDGQITQWPALFIMGVLLALAYEWTGSLLAPMLVHALNNTLALFVMLSIPGVQLSSSWLLGLAAVSPGIALALGRLLLRRLPAVRA